jgi:hypothetical protein
MKKTAIRLTLLVALLVLTANVLSVNPVTGNPTPWDGFPPQPVTTKPIINIQSPLENQVLGTNNLWLNLSITKPQDWFQYYPAGVDINGNPLYLIRGKLTSINYTIDNGSPQAIPVNETHYLALSFPQRAFQFNVNLTLAGGEHQLEVSFEADCYYLITDTYTTENRTLANVPGTYPVNYSSVKMYGNTEPVSFTIAPFIVTPKREVYNESNVPLVFIVDNSTTSWVCYSLDGKDNVTISGNTTLTGLPNGDHNVTIFATDEAGNTGASETIYFNVEVPEPFPTAMVTTSVITVAVIGAGLLVYFKKRKH